MDQLRPSDSTRVKDDVERLLVLLHTRTRFCSALLSPIGKFSFEKKIHDQEIGPESFIDFSSIFRIEHHRSLIVIDR